MNKIKMVALALSLGASLPSQTAKAYTIIGTGSLSCGEWTEVRRNSKEWAQADSNEQWVLGFLAGKASGLNIDLLNGTDAPGVWVWIDNYCAANPIKQQIDAADAFVLWRKGHQNK